MVNRNARFWIFGAGLFLSNVAYVGYKLVELKQPMTVPEMCFHGILALVAVSTFDLELGEYWGNKLFQALMFWRKGSTAETPVASDPPAPPA